ncbi:hypothetical protein E2562_004871 [Oryza meyeriana var. granulata]|uniref:Protein kinase domain-containing protein n=1 Tax=Oryza meyeriana var. granulata TaxID=110450 RepID=A0A6G1C3V3_9ORYZ|nr:hypothetical protein E2562_004871 [Oryza meyeriana var. granulata]
MGWESYAWIETLSCPSLSPPDGLHASPVCGAEPPNSNSLYQEILSRLADEVNDATADEAVAVSSAVTILVWGKDHAHIPPSSGSLMRYFSSLRPEPDENAYSTTIVNEFTWQMKDPGWAWGLRAEEEKASFGALPVGIEFAVGGHDAALQKLDHPNIVKLKEVTAENHELFFIFENMAGLKFAHCVLNP